MSLRIWPKRLWDLSNSHKVVAGIVVLLIGSFFASVLGGWGSVCDHIATAWNYLTSPVSVPVLLVVLGIMALGSVVVVVRVVSRLPDDHRGMFMSRMFSTQYGIDGIIRVMTSWTFGVIVPTMIPN